MMYAYSVSTRRSLVVAVVALAVVMSGQRARAQPGWVLSRQKISDTEGGFTGQEPLGANSVASLGDLEGDGVPDLAVANFSDDDLSVLMGNGDGTLASGVTYNVGDIGIVASDRGWYRSDGAADTDNPDDPDQSNYAAGIDSANREFRNWFVFDLAKLKGHITSMTLHLGVPSGPPNDPGTGGYRSRDPSELYELYSVETAIDDLVGGRGGLAAFDDLASGTFYGCLLMDESQEGQIVSIDLNADAVASANAARSSQVFWAIGGSVFTISMNGIKEIVFAGSHSEPVSHVFVVVEVQPCPWDVNGDGIVDHHDLLEVVHNMGLCDDPDNCPWDVNGDGIVNGRDVAAVATHFGNCPKE